MRIRGLGSGIVVGIVLLSAACSSAETVAGPATGDLSATNEGPAAGGAAANPEGDFLSLFLRETLTDDWFGAGKPLAAQGLTLTLSLTQIYQDVAQGGLSTHRDTGRYTGRYDLGMTADLDKMAGLKGASLYFSGEGGWSNGIDPSSVGSLFGVNGDAIGDRSIFVREFRYDQKLFDDKLTLRIGKINLTGGFDCRGCPVAFDNNAFAGDETTQFLNNALVNNPTIPFPPKTLGAALYLRLTDFWYAAAGVADANGTIGNVEPAFEQPARYFNIYETGYVLELPSDHGLLRGAYRVGFWSDPRSKERFDGSGRSNDDAGLYVSLDQMLWRESDKDEQGLGAFFRFGLADSHVDKVPDFWSAGLQYRGLIPGRDADVLAFGFAQGCTSREPGAGSPRPTRTCGKRITVSRSPRGFTSARTCS